MNWRMGLAAAAIVTVLCVAVSRGQRAGVDVGFWYEEFPFTFSDPVTAALGGPLTSSEIDTIRQMSRDELALAFSGLNVVFTDSRRAPLTIVVQRSIPRRKGQRLPNAGETFAMGPFGARSAIDFTEVMMAAMAHAPAETSRHRLVTGIGRGVGRVAVHELAHGILGAGAMDDRTDDHSYEYFTHNRPSQFFGELHWTRAWPVLVERVGTPTRTRRL